MRSKLFALWLLAFSFVPELFAQTGISPPDAGLFNKAVACIKEAEGWHGNHLPYVGYGHKILPHEKLTADMTEAQADSLLRADLRKLHKMCSRFGKDALLVATLAYNVGYYRLVGMEDTEKQADPKIRIRQQGYLRGVYLVPML